MINSDPQTKSMYNDEVAELLVFISDTKDGKYTDSKPQIAEIVYSRLTIP